MRARRTALARTTALAPATALALTVAGVVAVAGSGCGSLDKVQHPAGHTDLVNDLAVRLRHGAHLTYTAEYQLPGGTAAQVAQAQRPARSAYVYPGGRLTMTPELVIDCRAQPPGMTCTLAAPAAASTEAAGGVLATVEARGLVPTSLVVGLLSAAALDSDVQVRQHDSTIAGQHATCVEVTKVDNAAASAYQLCVTTDGVLGSFSGTVRGRRVELTLTSYRDAVSADAFALPAGARVVDRRSAP
ncbi:MAG TPA: hypothetical protein VFM54_00935 [Micromonosporaceae bacterium]|nr:hypothetical protein [Micromonosporaceae bacterium]